MTQEVSRPVLTAKTRVYFQASSYAICTGVWGGGNSTGTYFSPCFLLR